MLSELVSDLFYKIGHLWNIGGQPLPPTEDDVQKVLDRAAEALYSEDVGTRLSTGGLIIEKTDHGYDAFVFVGDFKEKN